MALSDDEVPGILIDVALARRLQSIVLYAIEFDQNLGWPVEAWKLSANELFDAMVAAGVET